MVMSPVHQVWLKPSCKAQLKGEEDKADRGRSGKTTPGVRQVPENRVNGGNWLRNHLWCPSDPRGLRTDDAANDDDVILSWRISNRD